MDLRESFAFGPGIRGAFGHLINGPRPVHDPQERFSTVERKAMASSNNGGFSGAQRRRLGRTPQHGRARRLWLESLEVRTLLDGQGVGEIGDVKDGPLAKLGQNGIQVYSEYLDHIEQQVNTPFQPSFNELTFVDGRLALELRPATGMDLDQFQTSLANMGVEVVAVSEQFRVVTAMVPMESLPDIADSDDVGGVIVLIDPKTRVQGVANNQADESLFSDVARTQFGVDGTGVTIGVLSDSANQVAGGLADSQATGDLPAEVTILEDGVPGDSDEGRAMLELIHDIAPGAGLAFHSATNAGPAGFADGILALREFGSDVIVDDIGFASSPFFQDGIIASAAIEVVNDGAVYFSSAGNSDDSGYESPFRPLDATVPGLGAGRYHDFDPGPGVSFTLDVDVNAAGTIIFQYDQPFFTNAVTSDLDIILLDANDNIVAQGNDNNLTTQVPFEFFAAPTGALRAVIQINSGPDPQFVRFQEFISDIDVDQSFGTAGGTTYPTTYGQPVAAEAIGVGAVPFFGAPPFDNPNPILSEDFSSFGPSRITINADGTRKASVETRLKPDVSGIDGGNTTFFGADIPQDPDDFPNFFGTSASAPNLAAVAALMRELVPTATANEIRDAMIASAVPLNGSAPGQFDIQGGFGLVNAVDALTAVDLFRVSTVDPAVDATVNAFPDVLSVTFNDNVDITTVQASDLTFTDLPAGINVVVGAPVIDDQSLQLVNFPLTIVADTTAVANGNFAYEIGTISSVEGEVVAPFSGSFELNDQVLPVITSVGVSGRTILIGFSETMRPGLLTDSGVVQLRRAGSDGVLFSADDVLVGEAEGAVLSFNNTTNTLTFDLAAVDQSELPSDIYGIQIVDGGLRDMAGNILDGEFNNVFPTGDGEAGGTFQFDLGQQDLQAPTILDLSLVPRSDRGVLGDNNTSAGRPTFEGRVSASFPGGVEGLRVFIEYSGLIEGSGDTLGTLDLNVNDDLAAATTKSSQLVVTNANGVFRFRAPERLPEGFQAVRALIVGDGANPTDPDAFGPASTRDYSFRIDRTSPTLIPIEAPSLREDINEIETLRFRVEDPFVFEPGLEIPAALDLDIQALDPSVAENLGNYQLVSLLPGPDGLLFGPEDGNTNPDDIIGEDFSEFIRSVEFVATNELRTDPNDPFLGELIVTFDDRLPANRYAFVARTNNNAPTETPNGLINSAGVSLDGRPDRPGNQVFRTVFDFDSVPGALDEIAFGNADLVDPVGTFEATGGPRDFYELPGPNTPRAEAPPDTFFFDFDSPLDPNTISDDSIFLIRSANAPDAPADGDFGPDVGQGLQGLGTNFIRVPGTTVQLVDSIPGAGFNQPGYQDRLVLSLPAGTTLDPDNYRIVVPNSRKVDLNEDGLRGDVDPAEDLRIRDVFGNVLDLEFLGYQDPSDGIGFVTQLPNGTLRETITGDGVEGGAFTTGFTVVAHGNVLFARADYNDDPGTIADDPDGSLLRPFPTLGPEADDNGPNFGTLFDPSRDLNGNGRFDRSAFIAAQELAEAQTGPVVIVALPSPGILNPSTGLIEQDTFVLQAPSGPDNDGSASVPILTTMVFEAGSILKMRNASLFVQAQGSALQMRGGIREGEQVIVTSFNNDAVAGDTNNDGDDTEAVAGDFGGIILRNLDNTNPDTRVDLPVDGPVPFASGADDVMSIINQADIGFGGGPVPQSIGFLFDAVMAINARPSVTNSVIRESGGGGANAGLSANFDSHREDDIARGIKVRNVEFFNNSLNGIWVRPELSGLAEQTDAIGYADNPIGPEFGAARNFVFDDPSPYIFTAALSLTGNRLYVQEGMLLKFQRGAGILATDDGSLRGTNLILGDRTYINGFDESIQIDPETGDPIFDLATGDIYDYGPLSTDLTDPNNPVITPNADFEPSRSGDAKVLLTALGDDEARTFFVDPVTGEEIEIVAPLDSSNDGNATQPLPGPYQLGQLDADAKALLWGSVSIGAGVHTIIDEAIFTHGGGNFNFITDTVPTTTVLDFFGSGIGLLDPDAQFPGATAMVTNSDFVDNFEAAIGISVDMLKAGDPLQPLVSGNPFFRDNVMQRNNYNGLRVFSLPFTGDPITGIPTGLTEGAPSNFIPFFPATSFVSTSWDDTDLNYILTGSVVMAGSNAGDYLPVPDPDNFAPEIQPVQTLTIQSQLPNTLLANGGRIAAPGESPIVKLLNDFDPPGDADSGSFDDGNVGAGFMAGVDDGVDPDTPDPFLDPGAGAQIRIIGIGGNETTGQSRVPVIITSLRDNSVGKVVRGVEHFDTFTTDTVAPAAGDGGMITFGANTLSDYNLFDPRNGNLIDNADIRFMTRIEVHSGGLVDVFDADGDDNYDAFTDLSAWHKQGLSGTFLPPFNPPLLPGLVSDPLVQNNLSNAMTISNSNLSDFGQAALIALPTPSAMLGRNVGNTIGTGDDPISTLEIFRTNGTPQAYHLFLYNNTISNSPVGVRAFSQDGDLDSLNLPSSVTMLHNTFSNNGIGFEVPNAPPAGGNNPNSYVYWLGMNNIFSDHDQFAIRVVGRQGGGVVGSVNQAQYTLFSGNAVNFEVVTPGGAIPTNGVPILAAPQFMPGTFELLETSAAIDAGRSEIGPVFGGNNLTPMSEFLTSTLNGVRLPAPLTGRLSALVPIQFEENDIANDALFTPSLDQIVRPPGSEVEVDLINQLGTFTLALPVSLGGTRDDVLLGTGATDATAGFVPDFGVRDQKGFLREDNPGTPNTGFGRNPFFDVGAFEFRVLDAPVVTDVTASVPGEPELVDFYEVGGVTGVDATPRFIRFGIDSLLDPTTINNLSVVLEASGGDGIFGNNNSTADREIDLSGRIRYNPNNRLIIIDMANVGLELDSDLYRIILRGTGSDVLRDLEGNPLDGENLTPTGAQDFLPSGDGIPGGDFSLTFSVDVTPPAIDPLNPLELAASSDTPVGEPRDNITFDAQPTFQGGITDVFPPVTPLLGQTVVLDIALTGDAATFDDPDAVEGVEILTAVGEAFTDINGLFSVQPAMVLPNSNFNVGPDGLLGTEDDLDGTYLARVRVTDTSGNEFIMTDVDQMVRFLVDTQAPLVTSVSPEPNEEIPLTASEELTITFQTNENIRPDSLNTNSLQIVASGDDGTFNDGNETIIPLVDGSVQITNLFTTLGAQEITFQVSGTFTNDQYQIQLGTPTSPVIDIAGNPLDGGVFTSEFVLFEPSLVDIIFVDDNPASGSGLGTRTNPFLTIQEAIDSAGIGDIVAVLPGVYREEVTLRSLVRVFAADPASTDALLIRSTSNTHVIRAPDGAAADAASVTATGINDEGAAAATIGGFVIDNPLLGNPVLGSIRSDRVGLRITDSNLIVRENIFVTSGAGIEVNLDADGPAPTIVNNLINGNLVGIEVASAGFLSDAVEIRNNTLVFNDLGLQVDASGSVGIAADVISNIFANNDDGLGSGAAISTDRATSTEIRYNLFSGNGPDELSPVDDLIGTGLSGLSTTPDAQGNFVGDPEFIDARDARPDGDTPNIFFLFSDFGLESDSSAIDVALGNGAPARDFLGRIRLDIPGVGRPTDLDAGPADIGAFEFGALGSFPPIPGDPSNPSLGGGGLDPSGFSIGGGQEGPPPSQGANPGSNLERSGAGDLDGPTSPVPMPAGFLAALNDPIGSQSFVRAAFDIGSNPGVPVDGSMSTEGDPSARDPYAELASFGLEWLDTDPASEQVAQRVAQVGSDASMIVLPPDPVRDLRAGSIFDGSDPSTQSAGFFARRAVDGHRINDPASIDTSKVDERIRFAMALDGGKNTDASGLNVASDVPAAPISLRPDDDQDDRDNA